MAEIIGAREITNRRRDFKSRQGLQIGAEQYPDPALTFCSYYFKNL